MPLKLRIKEGIYERKRKRERELKERKSRVKEAGINGWRGGSGLIQLAHRGNFLVANYLTIFFNFLLNF